MSILTITRKVEFDAGHRIPHHGSKCRHLHGHRYVLEATVTGEVLDSPGDSSHGMIVDFGNLKQIMNLAIADDWDHALLVWKDDKQLLTALGYMDQEHRTVILPYVPTAENLAQLAFNKIKVYIEDYNAELISVRLYETPNCWADFYATR